MSRMAERRMANHLKYYRSYEEMIELLKLYDELGLLNQESQKLTPKIQSKRKSVTLVP